ELDQSRRAIDSGHAHAMSCQVGGNRRAPATAKVEHRRTGRQQGKETIVPPFVVPAGRSAIGIPRKSVPLVVSHDSIFETFHGHGWRRTKPQATMVWQARRTSRDRG